MACQGMMARRSRQSFCKTKMQDCSKVLPPVLALLVLCACVQKQSSMPPGLSGLVKQQFDCLVMMLGKFLIGFD